METKLDLPYSLSFHGTDITSLPQVYPREWRVGPLESILVGGARKHFGSPEISQGKRGASCWRLTQRGLPGSKRSFSSQ